MSRPSDAEVMAYADGELDPAAAREVEAWLQQSEEGRRLLRYYVESAGAVRAAFAPIVHEATPHALAELLTTASPRPPRQWRTTMLPLAASLAALAVGLALGGAFERGVPGGSSARLAGHVEEALETRVSGERVEVRAEDGTVLEATPLRTFRTTDGRYCREFKEVTVDTAGAPSVRYGIACRSGDRWLPVLSIAPANTSNRKEL